MHRPHPLVTFLIAAHNRRDVLLNTLAQLQRCGLAPDEFETIVVDNASTDATADAIAARFPSVRILRQRVNRGAQCDFIGGVECGDQRGGVSVDFQRLSSRAARAASEFQKLRAIGQITVALFGHQYDVFQTHTADPPII